MIDPPVVVLTGAGISAESGVPTFRGTGGLWRQFRAEDLATPEAFARDPELVWEWYDWRRGIIDGCRPNAAHQALVEIENWLTGAGEPAGPAPGHGGAAPFALITQNVDGLHERAGSRNVLRLHGSIWELRCTRDGESHVDRQVPLAGRPPRCTRCGALLRPGVVWFGERLDPAILDAAATAARQARTMLIIGTSGLVYPAAGLPLLARDAGARLVEVNPEPTPLTPLADESLRGPAAVELPAWWSRHRQALAEST